MRATAKIMAALINFIATSETMAGHGRREPTTARTVCAGAGEVKDHAAEVK